MSLGRVWDVELVNKNLFTISLTEIQPVCLHFGKIEKSINKGQTNSMYLSKKKVNKFLLTYFYIPY